MHDDNIEQGNIYMKHLSAMTKENLNSKADIAGELAGRDIVITKLDKILEDTVNRLEEICSSDITNDLDKDLSELIFFIKKKKSEHNLSIYTSDSLEYNRN